MAKSYIKIKEVPNRGRKTKVWEVFPATAGENATFVLGRIRWFSAWRRYCFYPAPDMIFDANCLERIATECANRTYLHKQKQKKK